MKTYQEHLQESKSEKQSSISDSTKTKIKKLCETIHEDAKSYHEDNDSKHTYDGYIKECVSYMNECLAEMK